MVAKQDDGNDEETDSPSNLVKLSHRVKRLANIKLAEALASGNELAKTESKDFRRLMSLRYSTKQACEWVMGEKKRKTCF